MVIRKKLCKSLLIISYPFHSNTIILLFRVFHHLFQHQLYDAAGEVVSADSMEEGAAL